MTWRERWHALLVYFGLEEPEGGWYGRPTGAEAIVMLWDLHGRECDHGIGCQHECPACAEDDNGLNELRPVICAAQRGMVW